jgi:hypothetical protein
MDDWVYLKLQPYMQTTMQGRGAQHKLKPKFYGPFEVLTKIDKVAYHLNLPPGSLIHPVFHVSQLKKKVGSNTEVLANLPLVGLEGKLKIEPRVILGKHLIKKMNEPVLKVLVQ